MSFELPQLDTQTYAQLLTELVRRIPQYTDQWTDYNDSDPGITLLQLLTWIGESLLYQADRIPLVTDENFLRWVLGLYSGSPTPSDPPYAALADKQHDADFLALRAALARLETGQPTSRAALQREVLLYRQQPYMALTLDDTRTLAMQANPVIAAQNAQRAKANPPLAPMLLLVAAYALTHDQAIQLYLLGNAPLGYQYPPWPNTGEYPGSTSIARRLLLLAPQNQQDRQDQTSTLLYNVNGYLAPRVLAGSTLLVQAAQFTSIDLTLAIRCVAGAKLSPILDALVSLLYDYLLPTGGPAGGWRYGQAPTADDLRPLVLGVPGVEAIDSFVYTYLPTIVLGEMAQLGANTLLAALPPGRSAQRYAGLPQLRCLDITATGANG
ncbi:hypothetical protein [Burkholderia gladioli]|uniref:hypothetical protein n=1 Tax=Burkholderia gladioli TaxID=28095 RepID=UPI0019038A9D|nr:hypothetical protein [Burkholderia gladioli]MBJ9711507.1 hypothetical protein [Burkholderia gladioli]